MRYKTPFFVPYLEKINCEVKKIYTKSKSFIVQNKNKKKYSNK